MKLVLQRLTFFSLLFFDHEMKTDKVFDLPATDITTLTNGRAENKTR